MLLCVCAPQILKLRAEQAGMHGYASFADYQTADTMAQRPARVMELLENVWGKAKVSANAERRALEEFVASHAAEGEEAIDIQPWDWRYYAEKVRLCSDSSPSLFSMFGVIH
jgi:peptidyl-dipeptidase Dcp